MTKTVRDLMTADAITVSPDTTLRELAGVLSSEHIGGVPVVTTGRRPVGVVSATDLIDFLAVAPRSGPEQDEIARWEEEAERADLDPDTLPAYYGGWDADDAEVAELFARAGGEDRDPLDGHTAEELMTRAVVSIGPDAMPADAARLMLDRSVHRLLVVEDGQLVGVITTRDLIRMVADAAVGVR